MFHSECQPMTKPNIRICVKLPLFKVGSRSNPFFLYNEREKGGRFPMNPAPLILFVFVLKEIEVRPAGVLGVEVLAGRDTRNRDARRASYNAICWSLM